MSRKLIGAMRKCLACVLTLAMAAGMLLQDGAALAVRAAEVIVSESAGYEEGAYVEWEPVAGADGYLVFASKDKASWTRLDDELIRSYGSYFRADALGLTAGTWYLKIEADTFDADKNKVGTVAEKVVEVTVTAHDRSGYAWVDGTSSGAYNEDGSLKDNANVIYVTEATKDTVSLNVTGASETPCVGLQGILNGYKKGKENKPLAIRVIGNVTDLAVMDGGDIVIENKNNKTAGITLEGVGEDAVANGWGIRVKNASNVEIRNIAVMNCDSKEGDNFGLQQENDHIWIHHCDSFYGCAGGDADQAKGDGAMDCKKSTYVTFSYNHFWDNGKCCLLGLKEGDDFQGYITYHHNWFDHSDSRHPRVRYYTAHLYNNYYDGNAKYGIGSTLGSSIFAENNYFRNVKYPMMISMQGTDVWDSALGAVNYKNADLCTFSKESGGIIKAFGNYMTNQKRFIAYAAEDDANTAWNESTEFDAYVAAERNEKVPETVVANKDTAANGYQLEGKKLSSRNTYNNFDTAEDFYQYTADAAEDVPGIVEQGAGRVNGGDFKWDFDDAVEDENYGIIAELKTKVLNYKTSLVSVGGIQGASGKEYFTVIFDPDNGEEKTSVQVEAGTPVEKPADPVKIPEGKAAFDGWYNGSEKWDFAQNVTGDMTLVGKWLAGGDLPGGGDNPGGDDKVYSITVDLDGGAADIASNPFTVKAGEQITADMLPVPVKDGYSFKGWVDGDGNPVVLPYTPEKDMTIKAVWQQESGGGDDPGVVTHGGADTPAHKEGLRVELVNPGEKYFYTGSAVKPAIIVTSDGEPLTAGVDYTVKYRNNVRASVTLKADGTVGGRVAEKKRPTITVTGKGNYKGSNSKTFDIMPKDIGDADVKAGDLVVVKGTKAVPVLIYGKLKLGAKDYTVTEAPAGQKYSEDGIMKVQGKNNYTGEITLNVRVVDSRANLKKFTVEVGKEPLTYNGKPQEAVLTVRDGSTVLTRNEHYVVVYPANITDAGTVKFTVMGINGYTGSVAKTYKINPLAVRDGKIKYDEDSVDKEGYPFRRTGVTIDSDLKVTYDSGEGESPAVLRQGKDYKVAYSNNKKTGTGKFTISFLGNYKGSTALKGDFKIHAAVLSDDTAAVAVPDKVYTGKAGFYKSVPIVTIDGVALRPSDYKVSYYYLDEAGKQQPMDKQNKLELKADENERTVYVKVTGQGNYASADESVFATGKYKVCRKTGEQLDLSKAKVVILNKDNRKTTKVEYTGSALEPAVEVSIKVGRDTRKLTRDVDYTVTYVNNVNKGKATVIITATGDKYVGSKNATFRIVAYNLKGLADFWASLFG